MNKPWIVAELGANAAQGLEYALALVDAAADAGADLWGGSVPSKVPKHPEKPAG